MTQQSRGILIEVNESIAVIRINQPETRNFLSIKIIDELATTISELTASRAINSIIITGADTVFTSGANIRELRNLDQRTAHSFARRGQEVMQSIASARQLTVAVINGYCFGVVWIWRLRAISA